MFFGMPNKNETWQATEEALTNLLSSSLGAEFDPNAVEKAYRLGGPYIREKTRPVIVKFASLKAKELVLARRSKLRSHKVSVSEDYCQATRCTIMQNHCLADPLFSFVTTSSLLTTETIVTMLPRALFARLLRILAVMAANPASKMGRTQLPITAMTFTHVYCLMPHFCHVRGHLMPPHNNQQGEVAVSYHVLFRCSTRTSVV